MATLAEVQQLERTTNSEGHINHKKLNKYRLTILINWQAVVYFDNNMVHVLDYTVECSLMVLFGVRCPAYYF